MHSDVIRGMPLAKLGPNHHAAVRMRAAGASSSEIASVLGVTVRTTHVWFSDPLVKEHLGRAVEAADDAVNQRLADLALVSIDELHGLVLRPAGSAEEHRIKLRAIVEALDRCPFTSAERT